VTSGLCLVLRGFGVLCRHRFFFSVTAPPERYPLSLHDALPISSPPACRGAGSSSWRALLQEQRDRRPGADVDAVAVGHGDRPVRSEEHTSELQSRENLVCRLLLEKKKRKRSLKAGT